MAKQKRPPTTTTFLILAGLLFFGCSRNGAHYKKDGQARIEDFSQQGSLAKHLGDQGEFVVTSNVSLSRSLQQGELQSPTNANISEFLGEPMATSQETEQEVVKVLPAHAALFAKGQKTLVVGFSADFFKHDYIFGSVITDVSVPEDENLGMLKLADLPPVHLHPTLTKKQNVHVISFSGCVKDCQDDSNKEEILFFPISAVDKEHNLVYVDLTDLGQGLNLMKILGAEEEEAGFRLKTLSSQTRAFEYSESTLVFDIATKMSQQQKEGPRTEVTFNGRWYLRQETTQNDLADGMVKRPPVDGIGFFVTDRALNKNVQRMYFEGKKEKSHYYIKNVPAEFRPAFSEAFDSWNKEFKKIIGREILEYEFINDTNTRKLVTGDVRKFIVEWDMKNFAPYGGLGPQLADQRSGRVMSANVLVQGPKILELYSKWFEANKKAQELKDHGDNVAADRLLLETKRLLNARLQATAAATSGQWQLKLGQRLPFRIHSQMQQMEDPLPFAGGELVFEPIPAGQTYKTYMHGYFVELVTHELGHNLGLRHNFRGNINSSGKLALGKVSTSIMEYLGKEYRHLNRISEYDRMAIAYGYAGVSPPRKDLFCTDEDVPTVEDLKKSAECMRTDATNDPFFFYLERLRRSVDLLLGKESTEASEWSIKDIDTVFKESLEGVTLYAITAPHSAQNWQRFFAKRSRPQSVEDVPKYVLGQLRMALCRDLVAAVDEKSSTIDQEKTEKKEQEMLSKAREYLAQWKTFDQSTIDRVTCQ